MGINHEDRIFRDDTLKLIEEMINEHHCARAKRDGNTVVFVYEDEGVAMTQTRFTVSVKVTREPIPEKRAREIAAKHRRLRRGWSGGMYRAQKFLLTGR